jgi:hypothetical protein
VKYSSKLSAAALLAIALPVAAGCSGPGSSPAGNASRPPAPSSSGVAHGPAAVPAGGLTKGMVLPLEAYEETFPESQTVLQAQFILEGQCMRQYGFTYSQTVDPDSTPLNYDASNMARRYGLSDLAQAQSMGYNVAMASSGGGSGQPSLSSAENLVLTGSADPGMPPPTGAPSTSYEGKSIPAGGCVGQAQRKLGSLPTNLLADSLDGQSLTASQSNPTVIAVIGKWSACMKQHGFTVDSPYDASQLSSQLGSSTGSQLDITIAVDDVTCKQSTGLISTWFKVESQIQDQYIESNQLQLQQQQTELTDEVKSATAIAGR